ncbi:MAG: hypothetical protein Q4E75_04060, partial [bacterium]|nr:hypothetical protein [bacterium]
MKKIFLLLIFFFSFFMLKNIELVYAVEDDELIAKCVYNLESDSSKKIEILIDKNYNINLSKKGEYEPSKSVTGASINDIVRTDLSYESFFDKDNNFSCNFNLKFSHHMSTNGDTREVTKSYLISKDTCLDPNFYCNTYKYSDSESKVFSENFDSENNKANNWIKTCHYKNFYLSFNENEYETNIPAIYVNKSALDPELLDVMDYLNKNQYSCPTSLCYIDRGTRGYSAIYYDFKDSYDNNCILSQDFASEFKCGSLQSYYEKYLNYGEGDMNSKSIYNDHVTNLKNYCSVIFQNLNYSDPNDCVRECFKLISMFDILLSDEPVGECGFSSKLIIYISNIVRWLKYIIPVLVIGLGILDFIKAMSQDKDDEM